MNLTSTPDRALESLHPVRYIKNPALRYLGRFFFWIMEPVLRFSALDRLYQELRSRNTLKRGFFEEALDVLGVKIKVLDKDLARIPCSGPVIIVCNHPYGGLDGVALGALLQKIRPDSRLMVNYMLSRIEGIEPYVIPVDPFGGEGARQRNLHGIRQSIQWLKSAGLLAVWPAGTVSHFHWSRRQITDPQWAENLASIIRRTQATVVPVYFPGRNHWMFQLAGMLHPRLRTLMLPGVLVRKQGAEIEMRVGRPISAARLNGFGSDRQLMDALRLRTYILQNRYVDERVTFHNWKRRLHARGEAIAEAQAPEILRSEIDKLSEAHCLVQHNEYRVFHARASEIPRVLTEIGRLREITFRAVGEGTGKLLDLDEFDKTYVHLFLWNDDKNEIVGAYRLGLTDEILPRDGKYGLYSTTLFRYRSKVLRNLNPGIELGRSFIVEAYQRKHLSLGLIWKGIGQFLVRYPRYYILFGPVSISQEYQSLSKNLMVQYLKETNLNAEFASMVKARKPPRSRFFGSLDRQSFSRSVRDIEDISALIAEIEREEKGVPILLKQYLKLNATILSFNVDPAFKNCIDGLVLVDLRSTPTKILERYLGESGARAFQAYHEIRQRAVL